MIFKISITYTSISINYNLTLLKKEIMTKDEQEKIAIQDTIDDSGCQIMLIPGDNYMPAFAYTIGLYQQFNHPEIVCMGLSLEVMETMLNNAKDRIEDEQTLEIGKSYKGFLANDVEVHFLDVDKSFYPDYLGYGNWFYENMDYPTIQMIWPDKKGHYPWDKKFDEDLLFRQALLDRDVDFRFYESKQLGVFSTSKVVNGEPIKYVIHDNDGDWFFLEDEDVDVEDLKLYALKEIVKIDPTINSIYYLQYGWEARRTEKGGEWTEIESEEYEDEE